MLHWRLLVAVASGAIAALIARLCGVSGAFWPLIAWDAAALVYLAFLWRLFLTTTEQQLHARAAARDEARGVILALIVLAVAASLAAIAQVVLSIKKLPASEHAPAAGLAVCTLVASWILLQSVFALHYAHEHFATLSGDAEAKGFAFPGEPARSYLDFVYLAVCIGATGQVSDPNVTTLRLRNLVTAHGATAFFYNTAVLALGINILASLLSG